MKSFAHISMGQPGGSVVYARIAAGAKTSDPSNMEFGAQRDNVLPNEVAVVAFVAYAIDGTVGSAVQTLLNAKLPYVGVTDASNAAAGNIGEYAETLVAAASAVTFVTGTAKTVMSVVLTAGDWDVVGNINFVTVTATFSALQGGISTTNNTLPTDGSEVYSGVVGTAVSETDGIALPRKRISVSGTTTVYLVGKVTFTGTSVKGYGKISARRIR